MKIAIASDDRVTISDHFGRAQGFMVFDVAGKEISVGEYRQNIGKSNGECGSCDHQTMIDNIKDCGYVISHGMGRRIYDDLSDSHIQAVVTEETTVKAALDKFVKNELKNRTDKLH